jgi:hypothetical protein
MDGRELKQYLRFKDEAYTLRGENQRLLCELNVCRPELYQAHQRIDVLEQSNDKLLKENRRITQKLADLTAKLQAQPKPAMPAFVKANVPEKVRHKPGRKKGHPAALRPMPAKIDLHIAVNVPIDTLGKACCPECRSQLSGVAKHDRYVEELVPSKVLTTCYHTTSGWCPSCRKQVESRAENQPPAADLPHAQLGLNALATAAMLRVCYRLPLRQITRLLAALPGLKISPGAIVKQIQRLGGWLGQQYHRLKLVLRAAGVVYADETGWRTNGHNGQLWTLTNDRHTLYHVDRSRSGAVIAELLGAAFGQGGQTLVSDFYSVYDQFDGAQQKCLAHLLRELRDTIAARPALVEHGFFKQCKRLLQDMLRLKKKKGTMKPAAYQHQAALLETRLEKLSRQHWNDADADRLTARLGKYRSKLTTFLYKDNVDGTNNAAERSLRPAVVMRKITGGSRSQAGAKAWAILASVMRTAEQQGRNVLETLKTLLRAAWAEKDIALLTDTS